MATELFCANVWRGVVCITSRLYEMVDSSGRNVVRERPPVYSGMMSYEKAVRELPYLGFMFEMPIVVAGVGVTRN